MYINYFICQSCGPEVAREMDFTERSDNTGLCSGVLSCGQEMAILWSEAVHGQGKQWKYNID